VKHWLLYTNSESSRRRIFFTLARERMNDIKDHDQTVRRVTHHLDQEEAGAPAMMRQNPGVNHNSKG
jgi:hypothetical protein